MKQIFTLFFSFLASITLNAVVINTTCGENINWRFDYDKEQLIISGNGSMYDYDDTNRAPWYYLRSKIKSVAFENEMYGAKEITIPEPPEGYVTIVIDIPTGSECHGIALKGSVDGVNWSGANEYIGQNTGKASVDDAIKFTPIENTENWFQATYKLGSDGLKAKICLIYKDDAGWEGQAAEIVLDEENTTATVEMDYNDMPMFRTSSGIVHFSVYGWLSSECFSLEDYNITFWAPPFCIDEFPLEVVGSFEGWGKVPVSMVKTETGKYEATIKANPYAHLKVRGVGSWDHEIQYYFIDEDKWIGVQEIVLTHDKNVVIDYSTPKKYRWNDCADDYYTPKRIHKKVADKNATDNGITHIGNYAFSDCINLTDITIPSTVTSIGARAFSFCSALPVIDNLRYADTYLVGAVDTLSSYVIKEGTKWIGTDAFWNYTGLISVTIPNSVTSIGAYAFCGCSDLISIEIPNSVTNIGSSAFSGCTVLSSIKIPYSVTSIEPYAFSHCTSLTSIEIPNSVKYIGIYAFWNCTALTSITCEAVNPPTCGDNVYYAVSRDIPLYVPANSVSEYKEADTWKEWGDNIKPIQAEETEVIESQAKPTSNSVVIEWPKADGAAIYTITIKKGNEPICTLSFNEQGQLLRIAFAAPARNDRSHQAQMATQMTTGWQYTISGLEPNTDYTYTVIAKSSDDTPIYTKPGSFKTQETATSLNQTSQEPIANSQKLLINSQILILRGDRTYTVQGQEVR
jgi:hypothetical protein